MRGLVLPLLVIALVAIAIAAGLGWVGASLAIDAAMGVIALFGLFVLLKLPWDLYFQARMVAVDQEESLARGIAIAADERIAAQSLSKRLLILCLGLHLGAAALLALAAAATGGQVGYAFAGFYLASTVLRPVEAVYRHLAARLRDLGQRARHPREDVLEWIATVKLLSADAESARERLAAIEAAAVEERRAIEALIRSESERAREQERALDLKLDKVLAELERTVDRMSEDRELVGGLRALARLLRTAS